MYALVSYIRNLLFSLCYHNIKITAYKKPNTTYRFIFMKYGHKFARTFTIFFRFSILYFCFVHEYNNNHEKRLFLSLSILLFYVYLRIFLPIRSLVIHVNDSRLKSWNVSHNRVSNRYINFEYKFW